MPAIFRRIPKDKLAESVGKVNELARPQDTQFQDEMVEQYGRVKRFLSAMLRDLHFQAAPAGELQKRLARKVVEEGLSVRQTEALAKRLSREQQELDECGGEKPVDPMKLYRDAAAKELSTHWGRKVSITMGPKKGRLEFEFYNDEDLTLLLDQLETRLASGKGGGAR